MTAAQPGLLSADEAIIETAVWALCEHGGGAGKGACEPYTHCVCGDMGAFVAKAIIAAHVQPLTAQLAKVEAERDAATQERDIAVRGLKRCGIFRTWAAKTTADLRAQLLAAKADAERVREALRQYALDGRQGAFIECRECGEQWRCKSHEQHAPGCLAATGQGEV